MKRLEKQKESLKSLTELEKDLFLVEIKIARAWFHERWTLVQSLTSSKEQLESKIAIEKEVLQQERLLEKQISQYKEKEQKKQ